MKRLQLISVLALLGFTSASAQVSYQAKQKPFTYSTPAPAGKIAGGEFNGDFTADAIVLRGSDAVAILSPDLYAAVTFVVNQNVSDLAVEPSLTPLLPDSILTIDSQGLHRHQFIGPDAGGPFSQETLESTQLCDAERIVLASPDGVGRYLVALDSSHLSLHFFDLDSLSFRSEWQIDLPEAGEDFTLLDWEGLGDTAQIAVQHQDNVALYNLGNPTPFHTLFVPSWTPSLIASFSQATDPGDSIVAVFDTPSHQHLVVTAEGREETPIDLGLAEIRGMVVEDVTLNDGRPDLVFNTNYDWSTIIVTNVRVGNEAGPTFSFAYGDVLYVESNVDTSASLNMSAPLIHDIDGDGDGDLWSNSGESDFLGTMSPGAPDSPHAFLQPTGAIYNETDDGWNLDVVLQKPLVEFPSSAFLEIVLWHRPEEESGISVNSIQRQTIELPESFTDPNTPLEVTIPIPGGAIQFPDIFYVQMRQVAVDPTSSLITDAFPSVTFAFFTAADVMDELTLENPEREFFFVPLVLKDGSVPEGPGGTIVCVPNLDPLDPGCPNSTGGGTGGSGGGG